MNSGWVFEVEIVDDVLNDVWRNLEIILVVPELLRFDEFLDYRLLTLELDGNLMNIFVLEFGKLFLFFFLTTGWNFFLFLLGLHFYFIN